MFCRTTFVARRKSSHSQHENISRLFVIVIVIIIGVVVVAFQFTQIRPFSQCTEIAE